MALIQFDFSALNHSNCLLQGLYFYLKIYLNWILNCHLAFFMLLSGQVRKQGKIMLYYTTRCACLVSDNGLLKLQAIIYVIKIPLWGCTEPGGVNNCFHHLSNTCFQDACVFTTLQYQVCFSLTFCSVKEIKPWITQAVQLTLSQTDPECPDKLSHSSLMLFLVYSNLI